MSLPLWVGGGPVRARCGGSSLAELYGLAWIVRVSCTVVVGVDALVGTQSRSVSEFPPFRQAFACHLPPRGTAFEVVRALSMIWKRVRIVTYRNPYPSPSRAPPSPNSLVGRLGSCLGYTRLFMRLPRGLDR